MDGDITLLQYRADLAEKRFDASDARMARIEDKLAVIQAQIAALPSRDMVRGWALAIVATIAAAGVGITAVMLQASNNQLAAFQDGLAAVQTAVGTQPHPSAPNANPR